MKSALLTIVFAVLSFAQPQDQVYTISTIAGGLHPATPVLGTNLFTSLPNGIAIDSWGNVFFGSSNAVFKLDRSGMVTRVAGTGTAGYQGDGGGALSAEFYLYATNIPATSGLAVDPAGNLYVADSGNQRIRKVAPNGIVTTIAGTGSAGFSGDGGPAINAQLKGPSGLAIDGSGNLYIADTYNFCVRKISSSGIITTIATQAQGLSVPSGITVDQNGNVYVADQYANKLFQISSDGTVTTLAQLDHPTAVAVDNSGNIFVSQYQYVQKVSPTGALTPIAGGGPMIGDGGPASQANLHNPFALGVDANGNIFISDTGNSRVRKIDASGIITTVVGTGGAGNEIPSLSPNQVALDKSGNTWISDSLHNQIFKLDSDGILTVAAGTGTKGFSGDGGPATKAELAIPAAIAVDPSGNVFFRDTGNGRIRRIAVDGTITTVVGNGPNSGTNSSGDGGPAVSATIFNSGPLAVDNAGNLFFGDSGAIREVLATTGIVTTIAGVPSTSYGQSSGDGGAAINAHFADPEGIAIDSAGDIFIADGEARVVRKISTSGTITTVAGNPQLSFGPLGDGGPASSAVLSAPIGVAIDPAGNLYIADPGNYLVYGDFGFEPATDNRIRKVSPDGTIITFAGGASLGYSGDGGVASLASLNGPLSIAAGGDGRIVFVDFANSAVRLLQSTGHTVYITLLENAARTETLGAVSPGEIVNIYGAGLGPAQIAVNQPHAFKYDTQAAGTTVTFNGIAAQVLYASSNQVGAVVPFEITPTNPISLSITNQGVSSETLMVQTVTENPEVFTADQTGTGEAAALNPDGSANSAANPGKIGQVISVFVTGAGQIDSNAMPVLPVSVSIGGIPAELTLVVDNSGLTQVSAKVPAQVQPGGYVPIVVTIGDRTTSPNVWIAVSN